MSPVSPSAEVSSLQPVVSPVSLTVYTAPLGRFPISQVSPLWIWNDAVPFMNVIAVGVVPDAPVTVRGYSPVTGCPFFVRLTLTVNAFVVSPDVTVLEIWRLPTDSVLVNSACGTVVSVVVPVSPVLDTR